ncbi:MAG TPA: MoaD/ThiS family protein [Candidatus Limnocylindrales bacterium]|nr:MoaD/ThiS family protein [Candidatus Limnocylindrales bacterium]
MATVILPRSLVALFPGTERRHSVDAATVAGILDDLERDIPGLRDRLVEAGPVLRRHINVYVDGEPASLTSAVGPTSVVHVIPAVSGGARKRAGQFESAGGAGGRGDSLAIESAPTRFNDQQAWSRPRNDESASVPGVTDLQLSRRGLKASDSERRVRTRERG